MARILIVEDNKALGDLLVLALDCLGYDVTLATSGKEALELLAEFHHEVVFSDIYMEPMSGLELIGKVREQHPRTVFVFMSGEIDPDIEDRGMELGALAFVHKPINIDDFQKVLVRALKRAERQKRGSGPKPGPAAPAAAANQAMMLPEPHPIERLLLVAGDDVVRHTTVARLTGKGMDVVAVPDGLAAIAALLLSVRPFNAAVIIPPLAVLDAHELGLQLARLSPHLRLGLLGECPASDVPTPYHRIGPAFRTCEDLENIFRELVSAFVERPAA